MGMWDWIGPKARLNRAGAAAARRHLAIVDLGLRGTVQSANARFLTLLGVPASAVEGKPFASLFQVEDAEHLWRALSRGEDMTATHRVSAGGKGVWLRAMYLPLRDRAGKLQAVRIIGTDITVERERSARIAHRHHDAELTQGVIEFSLDGMILWANDAVLDALGYRLDEILGRHHSLFVAEPESRSDGYIGFWRRLRSGLHDSGLYRRLGKGGRPVWIQATYNPVFDAQGKPVKIVAYVLAVNADDLHGQPVMPGEPAMANGDDETGVARVLDLIDTVSHRANALSMDAAIDAALAERRQD